MRRFRRGCLIAILFAMAPVVSGRSASGILAGTVVDAAGKPIVNASVTVQLSAGLRPHATRTDANGHFQFVHFARGQYDLRAASQRSYSDWSKRVVVHSGKTTEVILRLTK